MKRMYQLKQVPSEAQIRKFLRRVLFGKNVYCPTCRSKKIVRYEGRYRCRTCRQKFSLLSHTWLRDCKLSLQKWWMILWCWTSGTPILQAARLTGLSEEAVRHWYSVFRSHLPEETAILRGIVQLDEAYGKGWAVLMGKDIRRRQLAYRVILRGTVQRQDVFEFLRTSVAPRSRLYTDGAKIYRGIDAWWPVVHTKDIHARWEFAHTSEIEGVFGNLRTFLRRMYHHVTRQQLSEYVREFSCRFSSPELFNSPQDYLSKSLSLVPID
jgi:transposase-like protein